MSYLKENNPQITKLNDTNYSIWKFRMEMILIKEDLYDLVENEISDKTDEKLLKRDRQARALINLCIEDSQIIHIKYETTAKATWDKLKARHERTNLSSKLFLLRKLYATKMSEDGNMNEHIAKILELIDKLKAVGEEIKDDHIAALLLVSVPKSYDHLITALEARSEKELTPELIKNKLTDEYNRRIEMNAERGTTQAFKTNVFKRNQNKNDKFCTYCKKSGHSRDFCFHLKNKNGQNRNKFYPQTNSNIQKQNVNKASIAQIVEKNQKLDDKTATCMHVKNQNSSRRQHVGGHINKRDDSPNTLRGKDSTTSIEPYASSGSILNTEKMCIDQRASICKLNRQFKTSCTYNYNGCFYMDSGASQHLVTDINLFSEINLNSESVKIILADGKCLFSQGIGTVHFQTKLSDGTIHDINLINTYYLPQLECNLMSVKRITEKGFSVIFEENKCFVVKNNIVYLEAISNDNSLYKVMLNENIDLNKNPTFALNCRNDNCINLWHKRLGHRSTDAIKQLVRENLADGIALDSCEKEMKCTHCIKNKLSEFPYPNESKFRAKKSLELVHSDLCGPIQTKSVSGKSYFLTFVDDFSRFTMIYLLTNKSEVSSKFKEYVAMTKNKFGRTLKTLRSDNGGEYIGKEIEEFAKSQGIEHQLTVPYSPQQNGVAERKNRSLMEMTRCLLSEANLPQRFWAEAVMTANYLQNRLPTKANKKTPFELWTGRKPDLSNIRTFGSKAFAYVHKTRRGKLDEKAVEGILIGYDHRSKGYRIYVSDNQVIISRTVKFIENTSSDNDETVIRLEQENNEIEEEIKEEIPQEDPNIPKEESLVQPRRSERINKGKPPERYFYLAKGAKMEPGSYKDLDSLNPAEKKKWMEAMEEEITSLNKNRTWDLVELPKDKKPINCKWTFKAKLNEEGKIERYKARLVAKGYSQKFGTDCDETFAPVVKHATIRAFFAAAVYQNMHVKHVDIKTAFLHGDLNEEIYMLQPEGYIEPGHENKVCKLRKAIYGLKQAACAWNSKIKEVLQKSNFKQSTSDPCLFTKKDEGENIIIILYVDDILISSKDETKIKQVIDMLRENFEIKNLGDVKHYLGINIQRNLNGTFELNQKVKIEELLEKFNIKDGKPTYIPMETSYLKAEDYTNILIDNAEYRQAIGALLYIATISRPDIALAVNILSRKIEEPTERDWKAVQKIILYLNTTKNLNLVFDNEKAPVLTCYSDADWAGDRTTRKSTSGNLFLLGNNLISWFSKRQSCIALSTTESEYIAAANAAQELQWILTLLEDLGLEQCLPVKLYEDNKSCIVLTQSAKNNSRTKHIDVKYHYIRHLQEQNVMEIDYCSSKDMIADILTKPLPRPQFMKLRDKLNLICTQNC